MFNANKDEKYEVVESGMLGRSRCPDCRKELARLIKIDEDGVVLGERARVCINIKCWRFTDIKKLRSWTRNMNYRNIVKALDLKIKTE